MQKEIKKGILFVLIGCLLFVSTACGYDWIWGSDWKGPYHHAAVFAEPQKTIKTSSGIEYSLFPCRQFEDDPLLYRHEQDSFEYIAIDYDKSGNIRVNDVEAIDNKLYCATCYGIFLYGGEDVELEQVLDEKVKSLTIRKNNIFYSAETVTHEYYIKKYDIVTKEVKVLFAFNELQESIIIETDLGKLFIDEQRNISFIDEYGEENRIKVKSYQYGVNDKELSFILDGSIARLSIDVGKLVLSYNEKTFEYYLPAQDARYYSQVKIQNNKIYFAVKDILEKSNCREEHCICRYAKSWVIAFDLNEKSFSIIREIGANEQVIAFSSEYVTYCTQEAVYRNGEKIYNFPTKIEPYKQYRALTLNVIPSAYTVYIADDGKKLDVCVNDNQKWLKDEYW